MGLRTWFRRKSKHTTTIKGENMAASVKNLEITLAADGGTSVYQTIRQTQAFLDDTDLLAEAVPSLSRLLSLVKIGDKRAVAAILAETEPGPALAEELDDLIEAMASGYGREVKKPARGKAAVDPLTRLDVVVERAEQMRESVVYLLASALDTATGGDAKKAKTALTNLDLPERLISALLDTPVADEPETAEPVAEFDLKKINNLPVKGVKVTA
ncbi:hypothetical protein KGQ19_26855 [Catenulispora sp. NL8]|uniref:Uncharacterized protein n=1 Tax=Catenulispora pinistramenti TaxID=2705254 RepID=A0ABS5KWP7_9ACTN|nr:hypothetical protein [Catenulispora pinistramenti]MBS2550496.1 hypothetical protein [Catenulispora pinistramenti]